MNAPKNAGSLTAGLLARKGAAQPAMRRQSVGLGPRAVMPLDDLGWNDMGEDAAQAPPAPPPSTPSPVALHIAAIQETLDRRRTERRAEEAAPLTAPNPIPEPAPPSVIRAKTQGKPQAGARTAFTLRIDAERHLRLRLVSAVTNRSAQQLLTGALDALIAQHPEIDALANASIRSSSGDTGTE